MKFLKFVVDRGGQTELCEPHARRSGLAGFLSSQFQLSENLQNVIAALTLSLNSPGETPVGWALPRIARHLTSIGVFGPGFGAVVPKWGGGAEISQVACRAGAVGGGIYVLGTGIKSSETITEEDEQLTVANLSNDETVKTKVLIGESAICDSIAMAVSKTIAVVSSPLNSLFRSNVEGSPLAAVSVVVLPAKTIAIEGITQSRPVYIMVHSSETGECPAGQCVLYATTWHSNDSKKILEAALTTFLAIAENGEAKLLYSLYYEQKQTMRSVAEPAKAFDTTLDLAFNDAMLDDVKRQWKSIMVDNNAEESATFMQFEDRQGMTDDDDDADEVY